MKKLFVIPLFLMVNALPAQEVLSVFDCYQLAGQNFPVAKQKELYAKISALKLQNITNDWYPSADLNAQATYQSDITKIDIQVPIPGFNANIPSPNKDQYRFTLDISQIIYDGGINAARKRMEQVLSAVLAQNTEVDIYALRERINQVFFGILILQETLKQTELAKSDLNARLKNLESGIAQGIVLPAVADAIKVEILQVEQQALSVDADIDNFLGVLSVLTSHTFEKRPVLVLPEIADSLLVENKRPEQQLFDLRKQTNDVAIELAANNRRPKLAGFAQLGYGNPGLNMLNNEFDTYYIVGAKLTWKLWDWNDTRHERQILRIQNELIDNQREIFNKNIEIAALREKVKIEKLQKMIDADRQIAGMRKNIRIRAASALDNGTITPAEYVNDLNQEIRAGINLQLHQVQLAEAKINLFCIYGN